MERRIVTEKRPQRLIRLFSTAASPGLRVKFFPVASAGENLCRDLRASSEGAPSGEGAVFRICRQLTETDSVFFDFFGSPPVSEYIWGCDG